MLKDSLSSLATTKATNTIWTNTDPIIPYAFLNISSAFWTCAKITHAALKMSRDLSTHFDFRLMLRSRRKISQPNSWRSRGVSLLGLPLWGRLKLVGGSRSLLPVGCRSVLLSCRKNWNCGNCWILSWRRPDWNPTGTPWHPVRIRRTSPFF